MPILPRSADRRRRELASLLDHLQRMREAGPLSEVPKLCVEGLNRVDRALLGRRVGDCGRNLQHAGRRTYQHRV